MQVSVPYAQWGQTNPSVRVCIRERFIAKAKQGEYTGQATKPKLPDGFQGSIFIGKIWGKGCRV